MNPPSLKLEIVQGPRQGETLVYRPGITVKIGRLVRGNNVTIKDSGISSKHLTIACEHGEWYICDLDSVNGTTVNSSKLTPNTFSLLHDGDTVKLGESTSILVKIIQSSDSPKPPRITRKRAIVKVEKEEEQLIEDISENDPPVLRNVRRRPTKARVSQNEVKNLQVPEISGPAEDLKPVGRSLRVTRSQKNVSLQCTSIEIESKKTTRGGGRRPRRGQPVQPPEIIQVEDVDGDENLMDLNPKEEKNDEDGKEKECSEHGEPPEIVQVDDVDRNENLVELNGEEEKNNEEEKEKEKECDKHVSNNASMDADVVKGYVQGSDLQELDACQQGQNENEGGTKEKTATEEEKPDLAKMTLGQWFDYVEVHLEKQIIEETELLIEGMRQKAERVIAYRMQKKREMKEME